MVWGQHILFKYNANFNTVDISFFAAGGQLKPLTVGSVVESDGNYVADYGNVLILSSVLKENDSEVTLAILGSSVMFTINRRHIYPARGSAHSLYRLGDNVEVYNNRMWYPAIVLSKPKIDEYLVVYLRTKNGHSCEDIVDSSKIRDITKHRNMWL